MLKVNDFRAYIAAIKDSITEITVARTVMDETQLTQALEAQTSDTYILLGIIPKHKFVGKPENLESSDSTTILILKKVVRSNQDHEIFLDVIDESQTIAQKVIDKLLYDYEDDANCNFMKRLNVSSFDINPIWGLNSCDGYEIDFSLKTDV
jgi:hypothetical protein